MDDNISQLAILQAIADIYYSMHLINLMDDTFVEYSARNKVKEATLVGVSAIETMAVIMSNAICEEQVDEALTFSDLTTIADRMIDKQVISKHLHGKHVGWIDASFVVVDREADGRPVKVIFATRCIDDAKRREEELIVNSNTDELTGFFNRRAYSELIAECNDTPTDDDFVYISIDVNGLKVVNDTLGHAAGDELLVGAAQCMKQCIGPYGRIFRIGGDEFVAIIFADKNKLEHIVEDLYDSVNNWSGKLVSSLSIACGAVSLCETDERSIKKLAIIADERMYKDKAKYYSDRGYNRRGQSEASVALCSQYIKILKFNYTTDSFNIVSMDDTEKNPECGFSGKISVWLSNFGLKGYIHEDYLEDYLKFSRPEFVNSYFDGGKQSLVLFYKRLINGEYRMVMLEIIPAKDYSQDNRSYFMYVRAIDTPTIS